MNHNKEVIFDEALSLHQQGSLEKAKELYKQILEIDSDHFDTLHLKQSLVLTLILLI